MKSMLRNAVLAAAVMAGLPAAQASYVTNTDGTLTTFLGIRNDATMTSPSGDAAFAKSKLLEHVNVTGTETFSNFTPGDPTNTAHTLNLAPVGASLSCDAFGDATCVVRVSPNSGRFDTTGDAAKQLLQSVIDLDGDIVLTFANGISAFGFYGTDIGDFGGNFSVELTSVGGSKKTVNLITQRDDQAEGSLLFFGFYDTTATYTSIRFVNSDSSDAFGLDDMIVGTLNNGGTVPEPLSALLALTALVAGAATRKRRG